MPPADLGDGGPVALGGHGGGKRRADDGLGHERGHGPRAGRDDGAFELVGELLGITERVGTAQSRAIWIGGRHVAKSPEPALVGATEWLAAREVQRSERVAVVAGPAGEDDPAILLTTSQVVGAGHLQGRLDRLGTAAHRVQIWVIDREMWPHRGHVGLEGFRREGAPMRIGKATRLVCHDLGDGLAAVPHVDHDSAAGRVQIGLAIGVPDRAVLRPHRDWRRGVQRSPENVGGHGVNCSRRVVGHRIDSPPLAHRRPIADPSPNRGSKDDERVAARISPASQSGQARARANREPPAQLLRVFDHAAVVPRVRHEQDDPGRPQIALLGGDHPLERLNIMQVRFSLDEDVEPPALDERIAAPMVACDRDRNLGSPPKARGRADERARAYDARRRRIWQRPGGRDPGRCRDRRMARGAPRLAERRGSRESDPMGQTRPFGTVWKYVLLKTILPRCQRAFGFGGFGGWS